MRISTKKKIPQIITAKPNHSLDVPFRVFAYIFFAWGIRKISIATSNAAVPIFNANSILSIPVSLGECLAVAQRLVLNYSLLAKPSMWRRLVNRFKMVT